MSTPKHEMQVLSLEGTPLRATSTVAELPGKGLGER